MGGGAVSRHPGHTPTHAPAPPKGLQLVHHLRMLLWNPHVSPGGPPRPAPVGSRPRASSDAGNLDLARGTSPWCGAGDAAGWPPPEAALSAPWLRGPGSGGRGSSGGLGRAERRGEGGERSGRLGGEGREPRSVCTRGHPAGAPPSTSRFHPPPFTRPLAHSYPESTLSTLTLPPPRIQRAPRRGGRQRATEQGWTPSLLAAPPDRLGCWHAQVSGTRVRGCGSS